APILQADFRHTALYLELESRCGIRPDSGWERVAPVLPTADQRAILGLRTRTPAYGIERLASQGDLPVELRRGVIRADRFQFVTRWGQGRVGAAFETAPPL
ncbi:MAG: UTRA domain-containing protein, partial [Acidimicrobiales bacterium]